MSTFSKIMMFDFDGVICDSTPECLVTSWNAWMNFEGRSDRRFQLGEFSDQEYQDFREGRNYVRRAGEYLVYYRLQQKNGTIRDHAEFDAALKRWGSDCRDYRDIFFSERESLRQRGITEWLDLHHFYPRVVDFVRAMHEEGRLYIVTLKDAISVRMLLTRCDVPISIERIWAEDRISSKLQALEQIIRAEGIRKEEALYVDDNVTHLLPVFERGYNCVLASWGYHTREHMDLARLRGLPVATLQNLADRLQLVG